MSFLASTKRNLDALMPGYATLRPVEKKRINEFSLVWQLFEGRLFPDGANGQTIQQVNWLRNRADDVAATTSQEISYFRNRYLLANDAAARFTELLTVRGNNVRQCINAGLAQGANTQAQVLGCTAVCFRLRNNLFHGTKALYGYAGQAENFTHGVRFLNACVRVLG